MRSYYYLFAILVILPMTPSFGQKNTVDLFDQQTDSSIKEEAILNQNSTEDHKKDTHNEWKPKDRKRSSKMNFSFLFQLPPKKHHKNHMKVFDVNSIFNFDKEITITISNTRDMQNDFRKEVKLIEVQTDYCIEQLKSLLSKQQTGEDFSQEIITVYTKIFELSKQKYQMVNAHTAELIDIFDKMSKEKHNSVTQRINQANKDPKELVDELLDRYKSYQQ